MKGAMKGAMTGLMTKSMTDNPLNVVVVDDDPQLRQLLVSELAMQGLNVDGCADGPSLWRYMAGARCDVVVLDIGLPGEDGLSIANHLRRSPGVGIVMLTGYTTSADQVRGLRGGADAYLTKPVDYDVLIATVESVGRRLRATPLEECATAAINAAPWALVADGWKLRTPDQHEVTLTAYERDLMRCLINAGGRPTHRETLIGALTRDIHEFDPHRLEMVIYRLRRKIKAVSAWNLPLEAVRGVGYLVNDIADESRT